MNHKSHLLNFLVIALCLFSYLKVCPVHISKTILVMVMKFCGWVMKFCGWIDLIKGECSACEP